MSSTGSPNHEKQRLDALQSYHILDTPTEQDFDELTELAAAICDAPISLISFVDAGRQWFKSKYGLGISETERSQSFCAHAILHPTELLEVADARADDRFKNNPLVTGAPHIVFYAGMPLVDQEGNALGSICVIDREPRQLTDQQKRTLRILSDQIIAKLVLRKKIRILSNRQLLSVEENTEQKKALHVAEKSNLKLATENQKQTEANESLQNIIDEYNKTQQQLENANKKIEESRQRFSDMIHASPVALLVTRGEDMIFEEFNQAVLNMVGKDASIKGKPWFEAVPELKGQAVINDLYHTYRTGEELQLEEVPITMNRKGEPYAGFYSINYKPLIENGVITGVLQSVVDVTVEVNARKEVEQLNEELTAANEEITSANEELASTNEDLIAAKGALEEVYRLSDQQKRLYDTIASSTPDLMYVFGLDYRFTYANSALLTMWGKTWDNAVGKNLLENGYEPWHAEMHEREIDEIVKTKQSIRGEVSFPHATLGKRVYDYILNPIFNEQGDVEAVAGTTRDVTERKLWEESIARTSDDLAAVNEELIATNEELKQARKVAEGEQERLSQFIMQAPAGLALMRGPDYVYTIHNAAYQAILPGRQLLGRSFFDAVSELKGTPIEQVLHDVYHKGITHSFSETLVPLSDYEGGPTIDRYFTFNYQPWLDDKGKVDGILNMAVEVTDQVLARKAIAESGERFQIAIDAGNFGTTEVDLATGTMVCNDRFKELFGRSKEEEFTYPDMFEAMLPQYREDVKERSVKARTDHSLYEATYQIKWPDGSLHWIEAHGRARYDVEGNAYRMVGILADVTEQKATEQRKNDFIGMVSHELKTPITSLNAYLQMLRDKAKRAGDDFTSNALERSVVQVKKMTTMINGFLNVSRLESGQIHINLQGFDMAKLVIETEEESIVTITSHKVIFAPVVETFVNADKDKIGNVINNLISNAVKYSPNGSTINIACVTIGNNAQVSVKDQGVGIAAKDISKLFDRYYRTETAVNSSTSGFGIGLYLSAEIIYRHHGKIWVESELGKGSTFYFSIPLHP